MRKLVFFKSFQRAHKKYISNSVLLKVAVEDALEKMQMNVYDPSLKTHKLAGKLAAYLSCSCGYNCRIIFTIEKDPDNPTQELIVLLDIGTHDDLY